MKTENVIDLNSDSTIEKLKIQHDIELIRGTLDLIAMLNEADSLDTLENGTILGVCLGAINRLNEIEEAVERL